jgi:cellulose synthase/poly-beta-1,6-N-acetylglucosamine synthase-like glycosyltransferase
MASLFWISCAIIAYVYAGYPALLMVWARVSRRAVITAAPSSATPSTGMPAVSIVIAARNEGPRLARRIDNLMQLEHSGDRQIVVVSDGSTDDTLDVLARYGAAVDIVAVEAGGKAVALNAGVAHARHEIIVFADARQVFAHDALVELTAPFRDPRVGAVTGELLLDCEARGQRRVDRRTGSGNPPPATKPNRRAGADRRRTAESTIADGVGLYWRYEKQIRRCESAVGSTLGATGAIYALRRSLWMPLPPETILDDVLAPMRGVLAGYRSVFNERARAFDAASPDADAEIARKVRTLAGNFQILKLEPRLLLPWINPVWFQYVSHKLGRLVVPYAMLALIASSMAVANRSPFYAAALAAQCLFYLAAAYGAWLDQRGYIAAGRMPRSFAATWRAAPSTDPPGALNA